VVLNSSLVPTRQTDRELICSSRFERNLVRSSIGILVKLRLKTSIFPDQNFRSGNMEVFDRSLTNIPIELVSNILFGF
jgi:hypothetical protein